MKTLKITPLKRNYWLTVRSEQDYKNEIVGFASFRESQKTSILILFFKSILISKWRLIIFISQDNEFTIRLDGERKIQRCFWLFRWIRRISLIS